MKNLLLSVFFVLALSGAAFAHYHPSENNGWEQAEAQSSIPNSLAYRICQAAQPTLYPYTEMTTQQLFEAYADGAVTITYLGTDPADHHKSVYQVNAAGGGAIVSIIDNL